MSITFYWGAPPTCSGWGICKTEVSSIKTNTDAVINAQTGNLEITFKKNAAENATFQTQFANGIFKVPVAYKLPADLCAQLGVASYTIKTGNYTVVETNTQYLIVFKK